MRLPSDCIRVGLLPSPGMGMARSNRTNQQRQDAAGNPRHTPCQPEAAGHEPWRAKRAGDSQAPGVVRCEESLVGATVAIASGHDLDWVCRMNPWWPVSQNRLGTQPRASQCPAHPLTGKRFHVTSRIANAKNPARVTSH